MGRDSTQDPAAWGKTPHLGTWFMCVVLFCPTGCDLGLYSFVLISLLLRRKTASSNQSSVNAQHVLQPVSEFYVSGNQVCSELFVGDSDLS